MDEGIVLIAGWTEVRSRVQTPRLPLPTYYDQVIVDKGLDQGSIYTE